MVHYCLRDSEKRIENKMPKYFAGARYGERNYRMGPDSFCVR